MSGGGILSLPKDLKEGSKEAKEGKYSAAFLVQLTFHSGIQLQAQAMRRQDRNKEKVVGLGELWPYQIYQLVPMTLT